MKAGSRLRGDRLVRPAGGGTGKKQGLGYHAMQKPDDDQKMSAWTGRAEELHNSAEVIIAKHRRGPTATVELNFEPDLTRFSCRERRYDSTMGSGEKVFH
jgi:hypothetical protein